MSNICRRCGSTPAQAQADALVLGLREEFEWGIYHCCELVAWADEQWQAWTEAAIEDCKDVDAATAPLAVGEKQVETVLVSKKRANAETDRL